MTVREKNLFIVLIILIITSFFFLTIQNSLLSINEYKASINKYDDKITALQEKQTVKKDNQLTKNKLSPEIPKSSSEIAEIIISELKQSNIVPIRYQILKESKGDCIEVSIKCNSSQFINYCKHIQKKTLPYTIKSINLRIYKEVLNVTVKYSTEPSKISPTTNDKEYPVEKLFTPVTKNVIQSKKTNVETMKKSDDLINGNVDYMLIGRVKESDGIYYLYIKNKNTNRIIKLSPEKIVSENSDNYILKIDDKKIQLQKGE